MTEHNGGEGDKKVPTLLERLGNVLYWLGAGIAVLFFGISILIALAAFVANLLEAKIDLVACDMPEANRTMLQFMAVIAEHEGRVISERTKAALQAAKERGRKLGWSMPTRQHEQAQASRNAVAYRKAKADQFANNVLPVVREIQRAGVTTLQGVAGALNARGIPTARDGTWHASTVRNLLARVPTDTSERAAA